MDTYPLCLKCPAPTLYIIYRFYCINIPRQNNLCCWQASSKKQISRSHSFLQIIALSPDCPVQLWHQLCNVYLLHWTTTQSTLKTNNLMKSRRLSYLTCALYRLQGKYHYICSQYPQQYCLLNSLQKKYKKKNGKNR